MGLVQVNKIKVYTLFVKVRLSMLVVFSAAVSFVIGSTHHQVALDWFKMGMLILGGFLVTGASNGFNQIIEKDLDKLMDRTAKRPLPSEHMTVSEATLLGSLMGIAGVAILYYYINPMCAILGAVSLLLYTLAYTPMKRVSPFAVFVGAIPGAMPPLLGWVAATPGFGTISYQGLLLFAIQFLWQFPHFWAIAWVLEDDYKKAGFRMLPSHGGRDRHSAWQVLVYTLTLLPVSLFPSLFRMCGLTSAIIILVCGIVFSYQAYRLYKELTIKAATQLMFGSFFYLPMVQLAILINEF